MAEHSNGGAVRVLELAQEVTGPFVGRIFALSGADVVKVESLPDGDPMRAQDPAGSGASAMYEYLNAGKRSVGIDWTAAAAPAQLERLWSWADLVVVDDAFLAQPPVRRLVDSEGGPPVTTVTPFGLEGPYAGRPATSSTVFAMAGETIMLPGGLGYELFPDEPPLLARGAMANTDAAAIAALVSTAALIHGGEGHVNDVSGWEAETSLNRWIASHFDDSGWRESRATRAYSYGGLTACADGYVMIQIATESQWEAFVRMMGEPDWAAHPDYGTQAGRTAAGGEIGEHIRAWAGGLDKATIFALGIEHGVPVAPFREVPEVLACPQFNERGFFVDHPSAGPGQPQRLPTLPYVDAGTPLPAAPELGEHTHALLDERGSAAS